jgi:hypothetical protein
MLLDITKQTTFMIDGGFCSCFHQAAPSVLLLSVLFLAQDVDGDSGTMRGLCMVARIGYTITAADVGCALLPEQCTALTVHIAHATNSPGFSTDSIRSDGDRCTV